MIEYLELTKKINYKNNMILNLVNVYHKTLNDNNQLSETRKLFKAMPLVKSEFKEAFANMREFDKMFGKIIVTDNVINACVANNKTGFILDTDALYKALVKAKKYCLDNHIKNIDLYYDFKDTEKIFTSICDTAADIFDGDNNANKIVLNIYTVN